MRHHYLLLLSTYVNFNQGWKNKLPVKISLLVLTRKKQMVNQAKTKTPNRLKNFFAKAVVCRTVKEFWKLRLLNRHPLRFSEYFSSTSNFRIYLKDIKKLQRLKIDISAKNAALWLFEPYHPSSSQYICKYLSNKTSHKIKNQIKQLVVIRPAAITETKLVIFKRLFMLSIGTAPELNGFVGTCCG